MSEESSKIMGILESVRRWLLILATAAMIAGYMIYTVVENWVCMLPAAVLLVGCLGVTLSIRYLEKKRGNRP